MANLHVILATTLDGYVAGESGSLDWIIMGDDRANYMVDALGRADTLMLGRKSYQSFIGFRPLADDPNASAPERAIGTAFNAMTKVVYSTSLENPEWEKTEVYRDIVPAEVERIKARSEKGVRLDGSISIVQQLTSMGLIDVYVLMVHPVALGRGRPLFTERVELELAHTEPLSSGVVVMTYRPRRGGS